MVNNYVKLSFNGAIIEMSYSCTHSESVQMYFINITSVTLYTC